MSKNQNQTANSADKKSVCCGDKNSKKCCCSCDPKTKLVIATILYWGVFVVMPYVMMRYHIISIIKDGGWFIIYFALILPIITIIYFFVYGIILKNKFKIYNSIRYFIVLILFLIISIIYIWISMYLEFWKNFNLSFV